MKSPTTEEADGTATDFLWEVGQRIKLIRETKGISRREMTEKANLKPAYGLLIEMEGQNFTIKSLANIAKALACDARDLMPVPTNDSEPAINTDPIVENRLLKDLIARQQSQIEELGKTSKLIKETMAGGISE